MLEVTQQRTTGSAAEWPHALRVAARIALASSEPMGVWWGPDFTDIRNEACGALSPEIWPQVAAYAEAAYRRQEGWRSEPLATRVERDGGEVESHHSVSLIPVAADNGGPGGVLYAFSDVTQAVLAQRQVALLRASEERSRETFESLPAAVYTTDGQGRIELFNEAAVTLWGREPRVGHEKFCGAASLLTPEGQPMAMGDSPMAQVLQGAPAAVNAEIVIVRPDGSLRHTLANPTPIHDKAGRVVGAVNMLVDISQRKSAEAELATTKDELASQVESLTKLHELAMRLGGISGLQPALEAVLETAVRAQGADRGLVWLHDAQSGTLVIRASHHFAEASIARFNGVRPGASGGASGNAFAQRRRWVIEDTETDPAFADYRDAARAAGVRAVHSTPIVTRAGELLGVLSVHYAERRKPSQRDMQVADVCARHAADAIEADRGESEMKRVEHELRELDERKNEFLATLAHELRNPLAPLRNGLEVMRLANGTPAVIEKARGMMERQLAQMVRLVDDLLDVSRVSRGKIELRREHVELAAVLRNAIETSQPMMGARGHELIARFPEERIMVDVDVTRLSQVFWNLLNNAAKYTELGGRIEISTRMSGEEVAVSVADNGIGIPPDMQARVFDIFTQVDRSLEKSQGGLGIGLSIAKRLVEMHGGTISVKSDGHTRGSEFVVRLPARIEERPLAVGVEAPRPKANGMRHRILVADDNADSATTLSLMLEAMGNEVRVAHDGKEAVEIAEAFRPDAILLDIGMPVMNGYDACEAIRGQAWSSESFIVALTGWGQDEDKERSKAAGFDRHIVKPVEPLTLERMIQGLPHRSANRP